MNIRKINLLLSLIVVTIAIFMISYPFIPLIILEIKKNTDNTHGYIYKSNLVNNEIKNNTINIDSIGLKPKPTDNTLIIPSIHVDAKINEGDISSLNKGIWHIPRTSSSDIGGNMVLASHRFLYTSGSNTFYNLDKLKINDKFLIFWNQKEYDYQITNISIVSPNAIEIENNTQEPIVTLFTCTPLWTSTNRLVVVAKAIN